MNVTNNKINFDSFKFYIITRRVASSILAGVGYIFSAPSIGPKKFTGLNKLARLFDDLRYTSIEVAGGEGLHQKFRDAFVSSFFDVTPVAISGHQDDGNVGVWRGGVMPDHVDQIQAALWFHDPIRNHQIMLFRFEKRIGGFDGLSRRNVSEAENVENRLRQRQHGLEIFDEENGNIIKFVNHSVFY